MKGQICGAVYRYEGTRDPGWRGSGFWGDGGEPPSWTAEKAHLLWQIKTSITGKPIEALEKDIELLKYAIGCRPILSFRPPQKPWSKQYPAQVEELRETMKNWPRDEKGRWKSYVDFTIEEQRCWRKE